jgi:hypothetical protein
LFIIRASVRRRYHFELLNTKLQDVEDLEKILSASIVDFVDIESGYGFPD